jgi:beta-barrel assembly-enhancing protease
MILRALLLSSILAAGAGLPASAPAQDDKQKPTPNQTQTAPGKDESQAQPAVNQDQPPPSVEPDKAQPDKAKTPEIKHDGGKNDVDAIGNRKVGGFDLYSIDTDVKIGKTYAQQIERTLKMVEDPVINEYVNRVGQNLVRNSDAKVPFTIKIADDDIVNAMSLPGGFLYVNSGLILAADDEAELAGAMAHEIAHVALRHGTRTLSRAQMAQMMSIPLIFVGGLPGLAGGEAARIGVPVAFLRFSRAFEAEADYYGMQYMYKAGYDPNALVTFFEKLQALEKKRPGTLSKAFSTHPQSAYRIKKSQEEMATILPPRDNYLETTSEFNDVKSRLAILENRRKVDAADQNKPALRRTSGTAGDQKDKDDDRPVLKRLDQ